ncbi:hypothetical protein C8Q79DRAFT_1116133 [Trametes meyenii]|nr:hypothetical protein C8Q79DRAFT_1116133 [Trametes meyenii]
MLEPLAATVLNTILPSRPIATHFLAPKSAFGMAVRPVTHALPHDFFTPHASGDKGKQRALPEDDQRCSSGSDGTTRWSSRVASAGGTDSTTAPASRTLPTRPRTRRIPGHRPIPSTSGGHIPSIRAWSRQVHVAQRRHASSGTSVEPLRHCPPVPDDRDAWMKTFKDVSQGSVAISPEDAWQAFESLWRHNDRLPGPPSAALAFMANVMLGVVLGHRSELSPELFHRWGTRLQEALHHVDPGIQDMPRNVVRVRWNGLILAAEAMLGNLDEAADACAMLFHQVDPVHKAAQRGQMLQVYTILLQATAQHRGARAVADLLVEHRWVNKYLSGFRQPPPLTRDADQFARVVFSSLSRLEEPVTYLQHWLRILSKERVSTVGSLLIHATSRAKRDPSPILQALQHDGVALPDRVALTAVKTLARIGSYAAADKILASVSPEVTNKVGHRRLRPDYHSTALFLASRQGKIDEAEEFYNTLADWNKADVDDQAAYLHAYAVAGKPERVVELFHQLFPSTFNQPSKQPRPNLVHYTTVMFAHSQVGDLDGVNLWLQELSRAGLRPDLYVYSIILQSFAAQGDVESMSSLLDQMRDSGIQPSFIIYTTLITTLANRRDPMAAERVFKRAVDEGVTPDRRMVSALMNAYVESGSWQGVIRAFDYLNTAGRPGASVTIEVFNTLMKAYVLIGAPFRLVANLFRRLGAAKLNPDGRTFALLIQSACDSGFMDIAEDLYEEMERLSTSEERTALRGDIYCLTILMRGYLVLNRRMKAKGVLDRMREKGIQPNAVTYAGILKAYGEQNTEEGMKVAEEFLRSLLHPDAGRSWLQLERGRRLTVETVFRPLLNAYVQGERVLDAQRLHQDMLDAGGEPTLGSLAALLDVHRRTGNIDGVRTIWPEIHRLGLEFIRQNTLLSPGESSAPTLRGHGTIMCIPLSIYIDALSAAGEHAEVALVWKTLKDQGLQFDSHNWNHLVTALVRAGEPHRAFDIVENVILKYQQQSRRQHGRERDVHPESPLAPDLPPLEEGDLPPPRDEAPLHSAVRRKALAARATKRLRNVASIEERGAQDFAHPLHMLQQLSPVWNTWRPHGATLTLLGRVLDHLRAGKLVQAVRPHTDAEFEQAALDAEEVRGRTEVAGRVLGGIYDAFPRTVQLVREYELMKRTSRRGNTDESS